MSTPSGKSTRIRVATDIRPTLAAITLAVVAILIDKAIWPAHGRLWAHLVSDASLTELHDFAARCDLPRRAFDLDHYDVPEDAVDRLIAAEAEPVTGRDLVRRLTASGLRVPQRDRRGR